MKTKIGDHVCICDNKSAGFPARVRTPWYLVTKIFKNGKIRARMDDEIFFSMSEYTYSSWIRVPVSQRIQKDRR